MEEILRNMDLVLYNQLIYQVYLKGKEELSLIFPDMDIAEYVVLHIISHIDDMKEEKTGKVYLKELSEKMELTMKQASDLANRMSEKGLVLWTHDAENVDSGTFLKISETGRLLLDEQQVRLKDTFSFVRQKMGDEKLKQAFNLLMELRDVLKYRP